MRIQKGTREMIDAMVDELHRHGINDHRIEHRSKHKAMTFNVNGVEKRVIFSSTASDWRAAQNNRMLIRKAIR